jgi:hypothetical protein
MPPPPYHFCNVTLLSRDNGFLRASASAPIQQSTCRLACLTRVICIFHVHILGPLLTCTPPWSRHHLLHKHVQASSLDRIVQSHRNMPLFSKPDTARATCVQPSQPKVCASFHSQSHKEIYVGTSTALHVYKTYLNMLPLVYYYTHLQLQAIPGRNTRRSYLVNPDMHTRHGFLVDLARDLHPKQYKHTATACDCMRVCLCLYRVRGARRVSSIDTQSFMYARVNVRSCAVY